MNNRRSSAIIIIIVALVFLTPILFYALNFRNGLSNKNSDWAAFGSFISGIYAFFSTLILAYTLYITQKNSKEQAYMLFSDRIKNEVSELTEQLRKKLLEKKYPGPRDEKTFFFDCETQTVLPHKGKYPVTESQIKHSAIKAIACYPDVYEIEALILMDILFKIENTKDELRKNLRSYLIYALTKEQRFWLSMYSETYTPYIQSTLKNWPGFTTFPKDLERYMTQGESSRF